MENVFLTETPPRKMVSKFDKKMFSFISCICKIKRLSFVTLTFLLNLFLDNCVHGDSMKPFPNNGTCAELVANRPSRCYNREYREFCCGSCNAKFTGKKG